MIREGWALIAEVGLWGWIGSMVCLLILAFPGKNIFHAKKAAVYGSIVLFFFAVWIFGMVKA